MFYAIQFDWRGGAISRLEYSDEQPVLPPGQVACTKAQHDDYSSYALVDGVIVLHSPAVLLALAQSDQIKAVRAACREEVAQLPGICMPGEWLARCDEILAKRVTLTGAILAAADVDAVKAITW